MVVCEDISEWVEEEIKKPVEQQVEKAEERCKKRKCKWWCLCCNKWFCWIEIIILTIVVWVIEIVGKWVVRTICEVITVSLNVIGFLMSLLFRLPVLGAILRLVWNWVTNIVFRIINVVLEFFLSWLEKKIRFSVIIPAVVTKDARFNADIVAEAVERVKVIYKRDCNVNMIHKGTFVSKFLLVGKLARYTCDADSFFADWTSEGVKLEKASIKERFDASWDRFIGYGAEIIVFLLPFSDDHSGCSFGGSFNYVVVDPFVLSSSPTGTTLNTMAHELGHACWLTHTSGVKNLMTPASGGRVDDPVLEGYQIIAVRSVKNATFW